MHTPAAPPGPRAPAETDADAGRLWAICLCADWCSSCRAYRPVFDALARAHPDVRFEWLDIEDEAEALGDHDLEETFPTLLIGRGAAALFLGPLLPQAPVLARLLESLRSGAQQPAPGADAQALFERVCAARANPARPGAARKPE